MLCSDRNTLYIDRLTVELEMVQPVWENATRLKKSFEIYKHTQGHLNKGDAPLFRKTGAVSTSHILILWKEEIHFPGKKFLLIFL
jgi:hypothetical protein